MFEILCYSITHIFRLIHTALGPVTFVRRLLLQEDNVCRAGLSEEAASGPSCIDELENCT